MPAHPIAKVVDATGAGDLFAAGFLHGLTTGRPLDHCARLGALAAAEVISHLGARPEVNLARARQSRRPALAWSDRSARTSEQSDAGPPPIGSDRRWMLLTQCASRGWTSEQRELATDRLLRMLLTQSAQVC